MLTTAKLALQPILQHRLMRQFLRFGVIGGIAAIVNFVVVIALVRIFQIPPLVANIFAFLTAFQVSFFGHKHWTFGHDGGHMSTMTKFFIIAIASFFLTEGLFALFLKAEHLEYPIALAITLIVVPPITFVFSKIWAFRQ